MQFSEREKYHKYKALFLIAAIMLLVRGLVGTLDLRHLVSDGYYFGPDNVVMQVRSGGPADKAGVKVGDVVTRIDGIPVDDLLLLANRRRPSINSAGSVTVKRGTLERTFNFTYDELPPVDLIGAFGGVTLAGLAFLVLGTLAYLRRPSRLSSALCILCLLFALELLPRPYLESSIPRRLVAAALAFLATLSLAVLLDYCLQFSVVKSVLIARPWLRPATYLVAGAYGVAKATMEITTPPMSPRRSMLLTLANGSILSVYILLSLLVVVHRYWKTNAAERSAMGLDSMLLGMVIGFVPLVASTLVHTFYPDWGILPGERFYSLALLAVPLGLSSALMKLEPTVPG